MILQVKLSEGKKGMLDSNKRSHDTLPPGKRSGHEIIKDNEWSTQATHI